MPMVQKVLRRLAASQNARAFIVILFVLLAAYSIPLLTHRNQNPILQRSGLSIQLSPGFVSGQSTIDPNDGFTSQALGHAAADSWVKGSIPYWNYYEGVGAPLAGGMQSAALLPLNLVQYFSDGIVYFHFLLGLISGIATFLFLRKLKLSYSIAVLGGVLFELNGAFAWLTNAAFNPIAFLPLLLLGIEYALSASKKNKSGGWVIIALALGLSLYAGFPETAFIDAIFAFGWGAVRFYSLKKENRKAYALKILAGGIVGLLLASPILVAFLGYLPYAVTGGHASGYTNVGLPASTLPALFMPYIFGPIFGYVNNGKPQDLFLFWSNVGGYITIPLLLVGMFGLYAKRSRGSKIYLAVFSLVVMLRIYDFKPIAWIINLVPGTAQVAFYRYSIPALSLAIIILAMFGLEAVAKKAISRRKIITLTGLAVVFIGFLALFSRNLLHQLKAYPEHRWWAALSICLALTVLLIVVFTFMKPKLRVIGIAILLGANSFILFSLPYLSLPKISNVDSAPVSYLQKNLGLSRFYTLAPIEPNYGSYFGIASINVNDLPIPKNWSNYIHQNLDNNSVPIIFTGYTRANATGPSPLDEFNQNLNQYEKVGVKYLVTSPGQLNPSYVNQVKLTPVFSDNTTDIYKLPMTTPYYSDPTNSCNFTNENWGSVSVNCAKQTTIIRHELYIPGWSSTMNGKTITIKPYGNIFQQITIPKGKSEVSFSYKPPHIEVAYIAFAVGALAVIAQVFRFAKSRKLKSTHLEPKRLK